MRIVADENIPYVREAFSQLGDVCLSPGRKMTPETVRDAEVLLVRSVTQVNESLLDGSKVRFVGTATIGTDHVDQACLEERGIRFVSAPGSNANSVAEYIMTALLTLAGHCGRTLAGRSLGIVGVGNVGGRVEKKAKALGMEAVLNDPPLRRTTGDEKYRPIGEIFETDIVTFHTPLTSIGIDKTYHLAGEAFFKALKPGTIFINSSRGGVHDTASLKSAIDNGKLKACVLDVWEDEPGIDVDLLKRVDFGTPHIAGYSYDGKVAGMIMIYEALCGHFGIEVANSIDDFLPRPAVEEVVVDGSGQAAVLEAVNTLYDIGRDDAMLRDVMGVEAGDRGKFFDGLRKGYHIRREFQNTRVLAKDLEAKEILAGVGFGI